MVQMTIEAPSFVRESMTFATERDMFNRYFSLIEDVDFREENDLPPSMLTKIIENKDKSILYTNI